MTLKLNLVPVEMQAEEIHSKNSSWFPEKNVPAVEMGVLLL